VFHCDTFFSLLFNISESLCVLLGQCQKCVDCLIFINDDICVNVIELSAPVTNVVCASSVPNLIVWYFKRKQEVHLHYLLLIMNMARNNTKLAVQSFFPRTITDWNNLEEETVMKPPVDSFRTALLEGCASLI